MIDTTILHERAMTEAATLARVSREQHAPVPDAVCRFIDKIGDTTLILIDSVQRPEDLLFSAAKRIGSVATHLVHKIAA